MTSTLCLLLKAPRAGFVKTRLAREVGFDRAAAIYRGLVERQARSVPAGWEAAVHFAPADALAEFAGWLGPLLGSAARFVPQCDGDLGARLTAAVRHEFGRGAARVFLAGGDCPGITAAYLERAEGVLAGTDVVIGPACDGGYVLLGLKADSPRIFHEIAWSTNAVLDQTLDAARRLRLAVRLLPVLDDVDDAASLERATRTKASPAPVSALTGRRNAN